LIFYQALICQYFICRPSAATRIGCRAGELPLRRLGLGTPSVTILAYIVELAA